MEFVNYVGAGLSVGLAGVGVAIGQGFLAKASTEVMGKRKEMSSFLLTLTILGLALVESAAVYGLVVAFSMLSIENISLNAAVGAGLSIGLAGMGAGIGQGILVAGTIKAINEAPEMRSRLMVFMILFVALIESAAIYGLVLAFKILQAPTFDSQVYIGMGVAIGFSGLGVAIGHGLLSSRSLLCMAKRSEQAGFLLTLSILGVALVESAAIYGFVIAFQLFNSTLPLWAATGVGVAVGLTGMGAGIGEGFLIGGALKAITRNPAIKGSLITFMVLFVALAEVTAIYGIITAAPMLSLGTTVDSLKYLGAGLGVGLSGLGVSIGIGLLTEKSLEIMGKNPKMTKFVLTISILGVALLESAVIYGLVMAWKLMGLDVAKGIIGLGAGFAIGIAGLGVGIGEGLVVRGSLEGMNRAPEEKGRLLAFMVLFVALVEVIAIYGLLIALKGVL